jgi:sugar phosphate isomerase/epimerase
VEEPSCRKARTLEHSNTYLEEAMIVGIGEYSLRNGGYPTLAEGLRALEIASVEVGYDRDGTARSLTESGERIDLGSPEGQRRYASERDSVGTQISALMLAQNFNAPDLEAEIAWVCGAIRAAEALAIPAVRIDGAMRGEAELTLDQRVERFVQCLSRVVRETASSPVVMGIENHGRFGNDPAFLERTVQGVDSSRLGLTLDVGNLYWFGLPLSELYRLYEQFAPHVKHTHVKNIAYPPELREQRREIGYQYGQYSAPLDEGDIDLARAFTILRRGGYDGDVTIEDESIGRLPAEERHAILRRDADHLRAVIRSLPPA